MKKIIEKIKNVDWVEVCLGITLTAVVILLLTLLVCLVILTIHEVKYKIFLG